jgi:hypothetical protein
MVGRASSVAWMNPNSSASKELEAELSQCKKIVAEQTLSITILKNVIEKKALRPDEKRELVRHAKHVFGRFFPTFHTAGTFSPSVAKICAHAPVTAIAKRAIINCFIVFC